MTKEITQIGLAMEYFTTHPNLPIKHSEAIDWVAKEYEERTGRKFRYPGPAIRRLAQEGKLIRLGRGVYKYDPDFITNPDLEDFTPVQREQIFKRDNYRCVMCGKGQRDGVEIHADHIKPKDLGGKTTIENGQTLCAPHNLHKKNLKQTDSGKNMFIHLYELSALVGDHELRKFCLNILGVLEKHDIDDHIEWER